MHRIFLVGADLTNLVHNRDEKRMSNLYFIIRENSLFWE